MAINPASAQQVVSFPAQPQPGIMDYFGNAVNAGLQGYFARKQLPQQQMSNAFTTLAQMKMLQPTTAGTPGAFNYGGMPWKVSQNPYNTVGEQYDAQRLQQLKQEMGQESMSDWNLWNMALGAAQKDPAYAQQASLLQMKALSDPTAARQLEELRQKYTQAYFDMYKQKAVPGGSPTSSPTTGKQITSEIAKAFLSQAGGDKNKARELARQAGYQF